MISDHRITLFAGHYGSGKTNLAVNFSLYLKKKHDPVALADLDIVNPYFRTKDAQGLLDEAGIFLISSRFANTNVDLPGMTAETNRIFDNKDMFSVIDVGGDDRGAYALGRYSAKLACDDLEALFVFNHYRPMTGQTEETLEMMTDIEKAGRFKFTGLVNNSNLGAETTPDTVIKSVPYMTELSRITGLPVRFTSVREDIAGELISRIPALFPIRIITKSQWYIL